MNEIEFFMKKFIFSKYQSIFYNHDVMKIKVCNYKVFRVIMMTPTTICKMNKFDVSHQVFNLYFPLISNEDHRKLIFPLNGIQSRSYKVQKKLFSKTKC